jgi:MFS family permease
LAALLASLDSALNIAFPDVTAHFAIDVAAIRWLVISYVLSFAVSLPFAGRIADRVGHLKLLIRGLLASAAAFMATGLAVTYSQLLAARVVQGIGAAMILGAAPALVTLASVEDRRGRALGLFQMSAAVGLAIGPLVGGVLVDDFGWRAVFLFRAPLAVAILVVAMAARPPDSRQGAGAAGPAPPIETVATPGALAAVLRRPSLVVANLLHMVSHAAAFAIWLLLPYYAINVIDIGAINGGLLLTVAPFATAVSAPLAGWLADRCGAFVLSSAGLALEVLALGMLSRLDQNSSVAIPAVALVIVGVSMSIYGVPNMRYVMGAIGPEHQGVAGSTVQMMRMVGIVVGVFAASAWFEVRRSNVAVSLGVAADGPASFVPAFRSTLGIATFVAGLALLISAAQVVAERTAERPPVA